MIFFEARLLENSTLKINRKWGPSIYANGTQIVANFQPPTANHQLGQKNPQFSRKIY